jgi:hypothetical protein
MDVLHSLEIRWFFEVGSPLVTDLEQWFENEPLENDGDRVDLYYVDAERADLNAKARGGEKPKLEYKYRTGVLGSMSLAANVTGTVERWNKEARIIKVSKQRRQRKFAFEAGVVAPVHVGARPNAGCGFELTTIGASRGTQVATACTLGFEAFGSPPVSLEALTGAVRLAMAERPNLRLLGSQSENYSTWLLRHFEAGRTAS